jgi:hypothetical protein
MNPNITKFANCQKEDKKKKEILGSNQRFWWKMALVENEGTIYNHMLELKNINLNLNPKWREHLQTHVRTTNHKSYP